MKQKHDCTVEMSNENIAILGVDFSTGNQAAHEKNTEIHRVNDNGIITWCYLENLHVILAIGGAIARLELRNH